MPASKFLPYVMPMLTFGIFTEIETIDMVSSWYPIVCTIKTIAVTGISIIFVRTYNEIRITTKDWGLALICGVIVFAEWIFIEEHLSYPRFALLDQLGKRSGFNPFDEISSNLWRVFFIAIRFYGLMIMIPIIEEIFWRLFLLRYIVDPDFTRAPLGKFTWISFLTVSGFFSLSHPEWLPALICCFVYNGLFYQTKNIFSCIMAHAVTNTLLGFYVLMNDKWQYL